MQHPTHVPTTDPCPNTLPMSQHPTHIPTSVLTSINERFDSRLDRGRGCLEHELLDHSGRQIGMRHFFFGFHQTDDESIDVMSSVFFYTLLNFLHFFFLDGCRTNIRWAGAKQLTDSFNRI